MGRIAANGRGYSAPPERLARPGRSPYARNKKKGRDLMSRPITCSANAVSYLLETHSTNLSYCSLKPVRVFVTGR